MLLYKSIVIEHLTTLLMPTLCDQPLQPLLDCWEKTFLEFPPGTTIHLGLMQLSGGATPSSPEMGLPFEETTEALTHAITLGLLAFELQRKRIEDNVRMNSEQRKSSRLKLWAKKAEFEQAIQALIAMQKRDQVTSLTLLSTLR